MTRILEGWLPQGISPQGDSGRKGPSIVRQEVAVSANIASIRRRRNDTRKLGIGLGLVASRSSSLALRAPIRYIQATPL